MEKLSLNEILDDLGYIDIRSARNWCKKNNVLVIRQGKNEFVIEANFKEVFEKPFIDKLIRKFGKNWESVYQLYANRNIPELNAINEMPSVTYKAYKPKNEIVSKYLNKYDSNEKTKVA